ncbi:Mitochondrial import inner membrane translocase subunit TIM23-1 [Spatholobus suberectus]|nr:Mitochondrial import inner membrane translocase subunit TIM23-1 [Spatholobus suberectus]
MAYQTPDQDSRSESKTPTRLYNPYKDLEVPIRNLYQLPTSPEYLFVEEARRKRRSWGENLTFYTGCGYPRRCSRRRRLRPRRRRQILRVRRHRQAPRQPRPQLLRPRRPRLGKPPRRHRPPLRRHRERDRGGQGHRRRVEQRRGGTRHRRAVSRGQRGAIGGGGRRRRRRRGWSRRHGEAGVETLRAYLRTSLCMSS